MSGKIKKTILVSAYSCCPDRGSEPGYGWNYLLQYSKYFEKIFLITSARDHKKTENRIAVSGINNISVIVITLPFGMEILRRFPVGGAHIHYFFWLWKCKSFIKKNLAAKIDLAHHVTFGSLQFGSALSDLKCPFIFGPVGGGQRTDKIFYPLMGNTRYLEKIRNAVSFLFYRFNPLFINTVKNASLIYCSNIETRNELFNFLGVENQYKIKLMLDTSLGNEFINNLPRRNKLNTEPLSLLWVGRLLPRKGIEIVLEAAALIKEENFTLTIAGDGPLRDKVISMIAENGLAEKVKFAGHVDHLKIKDYYHASDVLLFLSYRDSVGIQILEAFSMGLPVISFDQFGASLLVTDKTGIKIPVEKDISTLKKNIALKIKDFINNRALVDEMGKNAAIYATHFTWESKMKIILKDINHFITDENAYMRPECV